MRLLLKLAVTAFAVLLMLVLWSPAGEAHKSITSKFTYNAEVFPVFLNKCSHCHVAGSVAPMSLVTYEDAFPWAESLRGELLDAAHTSEGDFIKAAHRDLTARELDIVIDWAVGGTPEGDAGKKPAEVAFKNDWARGKPDLVLQPPAPFQVPADSMEVTEEFVLPVNLTSARELNGVDLLPGTPAVVRDATITIRTPNLPPKTIGTWIPRQVPARIEIKPIVGLVPGSEVVARIHYKKTWKFEGQALSDRSSIGLYFADK